MHTEFLERTLPKGRGRAVHSSLKSGEGVKIERNVTINRPPGEIYSFWRQLENLPRFMQNVESVTQRGDGISHWVVKTALEQRLEWDATIIEDKPGHMISWQSLEGADMDSAGSVWFKPAADGHSTTVKVSMKYSPPGGKLIARMAKFFGGNAGKEMEEDLSQLKNLLESRDASSQSR